MNVELSAALKENPRLVLNWAVATKYNAVLTSEEKEVENMMDAWAKEIGRTGYDKNHEISQMIMNTFTPEVVEYPSYLMDALFDQGTIGEFDDYRVEKAPKNTIVVKDGAVGGNVDRSFIDFSVLTPTWKTLQVETDLSLQDVRRGGYKTVANVINLINEALENKRVSTVVGVLDAAITNGSANYIAEATAAPTETSASALALYLADMSDGEMPTMFGMNKYIHAINGLSGTTNYLSNDAKDMYRTDGFIHEYQGCNLIGVSGQKKLGDGSGLITNQRVFGAAGKIGSVITRGEPVVLQDTDINSEKIHIKLSGYQFGTVIKDVDKAGKIVMAL